LAIGAKYNDGNGNAAGHVRVYAHDGMDWQQLGSDIDGEASPDEFGHSVSLSANGRILAIGARGNDANGQGSGHVRIYQYDGSGWQQLGADIDGEASLDKSGQAVSLSADGTKVAIGADLNDGNGNDSGHVRIYQYDGTSWQQLGTDIDGEAAGDGSGWSASLSADGSTVAIGAIGNDGNGDDSGHVRFFQLTTTGLQGPQGPQGLTGATGPQGPQGPQGVAGPQGPQGVAGPQGPQGVAGPQGLKGDTGATGLQGTQGPQGIKGDMGLIGPKGDQGVVGPIGPEGPQGPAGSDGNILLDGLKMVRGSGGGDGTLLQGEGFTVTRASTGRYSITFDEAFQATPTVVATSHGEGTIRSTSGASILNLTSDGFDLYIWQAQQYYSLPVDTSWHFIVIGQ